MGAILPVAWLRLRHVAQRVTTEWTGFTLPAPRSTRAQVSDVGCGQRRAVAPRSATLTGEGNPRERAQPTDQRPNRQLRIPPAFHQRGPTTGFLAAVRSAPRSPSHPSSGLAPRRGSRPPISAHCASSPRLNRPPACPSPSPGSTPCPGPRGRALPTRMPQSGPGLRLAAPSRTLHLRPSPVREPQMGRPLPQSAALCRPRGALFRDLALRARPGQPCPEERLFWAGPRSSCDPRTSRQGACPG